MYRAIRLMSQYLLGILAPIVLYLLAALLLGCLPVNAEFTNQPGGIDVYVRINPVHTDIFLPVRSATRDWRTMLNVPGLGNAQYVAFGWGDRRFYLETKNWSDLTVRNAFCALTGLDSSVMHLSAEARPANSSDIIHLRLTPTQLARLEQYVDGSFQRDAGGALPAAFAGYHYADNDAFYPARGHYSLFSTCNDWVRRGLAETGIRTARWSPFSLALRYQLRRIPH